MDEKQAAFIMHAALLASLVAMSHWGPMGLSSAHPNSQRCCDELDILKKAFPDDVSECLVEDCTTWLTELRASVTLNDTSCHVPEVTLCEVFADLIYNDTNTVPPGDADTAIGDQSVTTRNILSVVDTQRWTKCVIVYDVKAWPAAQLLTFFLSDRLMEFVVYDTTALNGTSQLQDMIEEVFENQHVRNVIVISHLAFTHMFFREVQLYDKRLGRTSGLRMFTNWVVTTDSGQEDQMADAAAYFDNVVTIIENHQLLVTNTSQWFQCVTSEVSTLLYKSDGDGELHREFQSTRVLLSGGDLILNDTFPNIRHRFNGRMLVVGTKEWFPHVVQSRDSTGEMIYVGLCIDLVYELASVLNFTYRFVEPPWSEGWGYNNSGVWGGLVGLLQREEVDLVAAPVSFSIDRALVMDATYPYIPNYISAIYKKPDPALEKWKTYLRPFRSEVLLCLAIALLLATCLVHVLEWLHPGGGREKDEDDHSDNNSDAHRRKKKKKIHFPGPSPDDGFWYLYGALLSQGGMILPKSGSGRMMVAGWWLFSIVMGATYSGNLIAFLTVTLETKPFSTFSELLDQDTYKWGAVANTVSHTMLVESVDPMLRDMGDQLQGFARSDPETLSLDSAVHMAKVRRGDYVFISDSISSEAYTRADCDLDSIINYDSAAIPYTVNLPRGSAYTRLFNEYVMRIVEAGLVKKWKNEHFADSLLCVKSIVTDSPKISVLDVQSVLYVGVIGVGLALIFLACELLCHRHPKLRAWTTRMGDACVEGCDGEEGGGDGGGDEEKGGGGVDSDTHHHGHGSENVYGPTYNNNNSYYSEDREGEFGDGIDLNDVILMDDELGGKGSDDAAAIQSPNREVFDFGSIDRHNRFVFDTVYSCPEDFGRSANDVVSPPGWDRKGSKIVRISDDVKICT